MTIVKRNRLKQLQGEADKIHYLQSASRRPRRANGESSCLKASWPETQEELMSQSESEVKTKPMSQLGGIWAEGIFLLLGAMPDILFQLGLQLKARGPPTLGRKICIIQSIDLSIKHIRRAPKMAEEQDIKPTFFHKYIKNTSTCGMILTEYLLSAGRKPQTDKKARKFPHVTGFGKKRKRKKSERNQDGSCTPGRGL